jgi:hypothetical protein
LFLNYLYLVALLNLKVSYAFMFCSLMKDKLKTICMFSIWFEHMFDFHCFIFMIFHLCSFSCYNMVSKFFLSRLYLSCSCFKFFWSQHSMLYIEDQDCVGACHLKNYFFVIIYLLEDEQELSLGMLICLKCIYKFWCLMLAFTPFT